MSTWIKICGLTNARDAVLAARLGADALGFVFHPASKRFCQPDAARAIISNLPREVMTVGVWFDENADDISALAKHGRCKYVQTYNPSTASRLRADGFEVMPAIPAANDALAGEEWRSLCQSWNGRIIIDTSRSRGEGLPVRKAMPIESWREANSLLLHSSRVILAGGLTPENVFSRLDIYQPAGVDVASGVESAPGRKDRTKLVQFFEEVRRWDAKVGSMSTAGNSFPRP